MALIFFDFDGVLVDSLETEAFYFVEACHEVGIEGIESSEDMARLSEGNFFEGMKAMGIPQDKISAAMKIYGENKLDGRYIAQCHAPMMKLLKRLAKHYPLYIITSNTSETVKRRLEETGIKGVKGILGSDIEPSKIKKLQSIMALYPGDQTLFIGDTKGDMMESKEAGIDLRLAVTWGWQKPWVVASGNPDYIFDHFHEIKVWFKGFMAATK